MDDFDWGRDTLVALASALKTPLIQLRGGVTDQKDIDTIVSHALDDIDSFLYAVQSRAEAQASMFETTSLGSIMEDAVQNTAVYARMRDIELRVEDHAKHQPVYGHVGTLKKSLELIIKTLCDVPHNTSYFPRPDLSKSEMLNNNGLRLTLRADTRHGYPRLGAYRPDIEFGALDIHRAHAILGKTQGPSGNLTQLGALRVAIASKLLSVVDVKLRSAKANGERGIAFALLPSNQLGLLEL